MSLAKSATMPMVTVIIPCSNEARFIGKCLDSVIANNYEEGRLEILVVDGGSEDGTRRILKNYTKEYSYIKMLDNPERITPSALNIGVRNATGDFIVRLDAHTSCANDYLRECIHYLNEYGADNVGGILATVPTKDTLIGKSIALALSNRFGVGNSYFRTGCSAEPRWVDTVPFGCFRKEVFDKVGFFDERLARSQDMEFNIRLRKAGGGILLVPSIVCNYYARSDLGEFFRYSFSNGAWAILPFKHVKKAVAWRHLIPLVFVSALLISICLSIILDPFVFILAAILTLYFLTTLFFSMKIALSEKEYRYLAILPIVFALLHVGYGLGSLSAIPRVAFSREFWQNRFGRSMQTCSSIAQ